MMYESIFNKIDEIWGNEVAFLQKLGKFQSTLGNETPLQRFVSNSFQEMGLETSEFIPDIKKLSAHPAYSPVEWSYDNRPIVVGKWATKGPKLGKSLILQGHIDVVSPEPIEFWDYDPWGSTIIGDRMYGRGICDMKAGVAAMTYAVKAIKDCGIELGADVILETVYEEECTGNGALATLIEGFRADGGLIPEPFGPTGLLAQVGAIWMRVRITGSGSHVKSADKAVNAIEKAEVMIQAIQDYRHKINYEDPKPEIYQHVDHPLNVNIGKIQSGDWASTVPSDCVFEVRVGLYPGEEPQKIKDDIKDYLLEVASKDSWLKENKPEVTFYGYHAHGVELDKDQEIFDYLSSAHNKIHDKQMEFVVETALTDIRFYNLFYDIPMTCYGPVGDNLHAANEWVSLQSVKECTKVYAAFILEWCGIREK